MLQGLVDVDPLGRIQHEDLIQQVLQLMHFLTLVFQEPLATDQVGQQVLCGVNGAHDSDSASL